MRPSGDCGAEAARAAPERTRARSTPPRRPSLVPSFSAGAERNTAPRASSSWAPRQENLVTRRRAAPRGLSCRMAAMSCAATSSRVVPSRASARALVQRRVTSSRAGRPLRRGAPPPAPPPTRRPPTHPPRTPTSTPRCTKPCTRPTRGARGSRHSFPWTRAPRCWRSTARARSWRRATRARRVRRSRSTSTPGRKPSCGWTSAACF